MKKVFFVYVFIVFISVVWSLIKHEDLEIENHDVGLDIREYEYTLPLLNATFEDCNGAVSFSSEEPHIALLFEEDFWDCRDFMAHLSKKEYQQAKVYLAVSRLDRIDSLHYAFIKMTSPTALVSKKDLTEILSLVGKQVTISSNPSEATYYFNSRSYKGVNWTMFTIHLISSLIVFHQIYFTFTHPQSLGSKAKYSIYFLFLYALITRMIQYAAITRGTFYWFLWWSYFIAGEISFSILLGLWLSVSSSLFTQKKAKMLKILNIVCSTGACFCMFILIFIGFITGPVLLIPFLLLIPFIFIQNLTFGISGFMIMSGLKNATTTSNNKKFLIKKFTIMMIGVVSVFFLYIVMIGSLTFVFTLSGVISPVGSVILDCLFDCGGLIFMGCLMIGLFKGRNDKATSSATNSTDKLQQSAHLSISDSNTEK